MTGVITDDMCSSMATADQTLAKIAASFAVKDRKVWFCFNLKIFERLYIPMKYS